MWHKMFVVGLSLMVIAMLAVVSAEAVTVTATFYYHGLDLDAGNPVRADTSVVIVVHGAQGSLPEQFFKPEGYAPHFAPAVNLYFEYASDAGMTLAFLATQTRLNGISRALENTPYASVSAEMTASLTFEALAPIPLTLNPDQTIILRTTDGVHLKIGNFARSGFGLQCEFQSLFPEINVKQGATQIPHATGSYSFGTVTVGSSSATITFTIENTGGSSLAVSTIQKGGTNPADFIVTQAASSSVAAGGSTTFTIRFAPTATGSRTATISIANTDSSENPYTFTVSGAGQASNSYLLWTK